MSRAGRRTVVLLMQLAACVAFPSCKNHESGPASPPVASVPPAMRYDSHLAAGGGIPPGAIASNPHSGNAAVAKSGGALFVTMNCNGCHGDDGAGWVGPSLADGRWRFGGSDAEIFSSIYYGRSKGMPAFGDALGVEGVWTLVTYLQSLPVPSTLATESWEAE
jgi:cytochrome c oxidase cbb3-type subunit 3